MSVIIRLQNLPWSANALDIRNFFRGLSIPEGGVHIVGGELGDAFIAFSTDEDARQAMMHDGGKLKEIQVKLFLSSRSEMHKVIETARNSVPLMSLAPAPHVPVPVPAPPAPAPAPVALGPFATALGTSHLMGIGAPAIPGLGNPLEIPQPAVIEPPPPIITNFSPEDRDDDDRSKRDSKDRRRSRSRSREKKDRPRGRRDRSRSRERRRRSRSRDRRDRKRDRKDRSRSRDRSPRKSRGDRRSDERTNGVTREETPVLNNKPIMPGFNMKQENGPVAPLEYVMQPAAVPALVRAPFPQSPTPAPPERPRLDPDMMDTLNRIQELGKKRNPHAFQGDVPTNGMEGRGGGARGRRDGRPSRFDDDGADRCVVLKNAPNHTSYGDVRRFFPYMIDKDGIKMINSPVGRRTGTIFVRFCDPRSKHLALQGGDRELKGAQVTLEPLTDQEFDAAVDSFLPFRNEEMVEPERPNEPYTVLKVSDLPVFVQEHDIVKCFGDFSLLSIGLTSCRVTRTKTALVQFVKPEDAREAFLRRERYLFGRRKPVVTIAVDTDLQPEEEEPDLQPYAVMPEPYPVMQEPYAPAPAVPEPPRDPRTRRALPGPLSAGLPVPPQFLAPQFPVAFPQRFPPPRFPSAPEPVPAWPPMDEGPADCVLVKGLPPDATDRTIVEFLSWARAAPARVHIMLDAGGAPTGDCFCEFRDPEDASRAASCHGRELAGRRVTVDLVSRSLMEDALDGPRDRRQALPPDHPEHNNFFERSRGFGRGGFRPRGGRGFVRGRGRGGPPRFERPPTGPVDEPELEDFGAPGCVVSMENVPFRASVSDILQFFGDFQLSQDDIIRRFNERGQPTGDARVAFRTPFDAQRAVTTRQLAPIHERRISLSII